MEPAIQYAQTSDGINIAYWTLGDGQPFILMPSTPTSSSLRAWRSPEGRAWMERLAANRKLIRYDSRGFGNSQHDVTDFSLDARVRDLAAVIDRVAQGPADLFGYLGSGPIAIAYAARFPQRVSHLILWCTSMRGEQFISEATRTALSALREADWELYTEAMAAAVLREVRGIDTRAYAASLREVMTKETEAAFAQAPPIDVEDVLPLVAVPTLVLHRRAVSWPPVDDAQNLAAHIPSARLLVLDGDSPVPYLGDMEPVLQAIGEFLGGAVPSAVPAPPAVPAGLVTILFTDMESSTALTQQLGDAQAQELVRTHNTIVREALPAHGGSEIKHTGDGIMASFPTASGALECAVAIQRAVAANGQQHNAPLSVHIGLNAGEPVAEEQDLFGTAVQLARRICEQADGGEIFAANVVRELAAGKGFLFSDRGDATLRGFEDPVRLWEVRWREG
jgi:class 3 adenylate cyclase/pimeloyl-ACP methyl ester carboxylesterase